MDANKLPDYTKYALVPPAASRLPFRLATKHAAAAAQTRQRTDVEETAASAVDQAAAESQMSASDSTTSPQFTGIQHIIRHLESITAASTGTRTPIYHHRPFDGGGRQPDAGHMPSSALRNVGTSPLNCVEISVKQTQTSPKTSVRLSDDKNTTVKSRSLESQQQQQSNAPATSTMVALALPRSTTATHSTAIPLPAPPAAAAASPASTGATYRQHESATSAERNGEQS